MAGWPGAAATDRGIPACSLRVTQVRSGGAVLAGCDRMHMESWEPPWWDLGITFGGTRWGGPRWPNCRPWRPVLPEFHRLPIRKESPASPARFGRPRPGGLSARTVSASTERRFIMKPHDDDPTLTHPWMRWLCRLRDWATKKVARHSRTVKHQVIRGASYGVGSGAVSLLVLWYEHRR